MEELKEWLKHNVNNIEMSLDDSMEELKEWLKRKEVRHGVQMMIAWKSLKSG